MKNWNLEEMKQPDYYVFTLPNGLRCIHTKTMGQVSYCGVAVNAGSRDDLSGLYGTAHFVEHTIFKGTAHRSSWHISNRMESVGGELNAYTTKEETVIYTNAPRGYVERSFELLSDLVSYANFPANEVDKEREVVIEEINSYLDSPADSVFDEFEDRMYNGSGVGHNILGTTESVKGLKSQNCRAFIDTFYTPVNMVLYCSDPSTHDRIERLAMKYFGHLTHPSIECQRTTPVVNPVFNEVINRNGHQTHTLMGTRFSNRSDSRRFALFLLNNKLGGPCMNSILNQELREKKGYVYTVDSVVSLMSDCGHLAIYFGCDDSNVKKCTQLVKAEVEKLANSPMKAKVFEMAKRQYVGQLLVSSDHRESCAMNTGKSILYYNEVHDINWTSERILSLTAEDVRAVAEDIMKSGFSVLTLK